MGWRTRQGYRKKIDPVQARTERASPVTLIPCLLNTAEQRPFPGPEDVFFY